MGQGLISPDARRSRHSIEGDEGYFCVTTDHWGASVADNNLLPKKVAQQASNAHVVSAISLFIVRVPETRTIKSNQKNLAKR